MKNLPLYISTIFGLTTILLITGLFTTSKSKLFIDNWNVKTLTLLHIIRLPVEIFLFWLFLNESVPELMTFIGRNFDILAGLTAPILFYSGYIKKRINKKGIPVGNFICLGLLINMVVNAILSVPIPFQKFTFKQPNSAVLYFPFNWLLSCVVPLVLLSHWVIIRKLLYVVKRKASVNTA